MATKMQRLLPSLREKKRYLVFRVLSKSKIQSQNNLLSQLKLEISSYFGQLGMSLAGIQLMKELYNPETQSGIIRVSNRFVNQLKTSLMLITQLNESEVIVKSVNVSGMINKAKTHI
ncbi:MAG: Rpp14/Pop5 family protein [Candidatus Woesearchaeota archaeon]